MVQRIFLVGALLGGEMSAAPTEPSAPAGTGVVSVAPCNTDLGEGWGEREVIFAIDPLEHPAERVNTLPVESPTERARRILEDGRKALAKNGSVGMTDILYRHSAGELELVISRYPDRQSLDKRWRELSGEFDTNTVSPKVGQSAAWLAMDAGAPGRVFVFRQGLFTGWAECKVALSGKPLMELVEVAAGRMAKAAEPQHAPGASPPVKLVSPRKSPPASSPAPTMFVAAGTVEYENLWAKDPEIIPAAAKLGFESQGANTTDFTISVSNSCYLLRLEPQKPNPVRYHEAAFDGLTLYFLSELNVGGLQDDPRLRGKPNVATAWIYDRQQIVYSLSAHQMGPVWLMLASGQYLRGVTNGLIQPPLTLGLFENDDYFPKPFTIPARWELQPVFPFLPLKMTCRDDGQSRTAPPFHDAAREPPLDVGFTNIVFRVTATRDFDGVKVPSSAELDTYRPALRGKRELRPYTRYRLTLADWRKGIPKVSFIPKLPGLTTISDMRSFTGGHNITTTSSEWPHAE